MMFDELGRAIEEASGETQIPISLPLDEHGYFDRRCPNPECQVHFKVLFEDWRDKVRDEVVYCAVCRFEAPATEWNTEEQDEYIKQVALQYIHQQLTGALQEGIQQANRRAPKKGFIRLSFSYKPGPKPIVVPIEALEAMQQQFTCEQCATRYTAIGAAFFCVACGHNSAISMFAGSVETVQHTVAGLDAIRSTLTQAFNIDVAENTTRQILEASVEKLVSAFQRLAEQLFAKTPNHAQARVRRNAFQNLAEGSQLWQQATGTGYDQLLTPAELARLHRLFQQRHLLAHQEGIVDQDYINRSGDATYIVGQRLVVREALVLELAALVKKLGEGLQSLV